MNNGALVFEAGKSYGNDLTIEVVKRTAKTLTIKTNAWGITRVKIREFNPNCESIHFKAWVVDAAEAFDADTAANNSMYRAYHC